eukprot:COSAG06_NODE_41750_length_388_cov_0.737024_1_plen_25_part_01
MRVALRAEPDLPKGGSEADLEENGQ